MTSPRFAIASLIVLAGCGGGSSAPPHGLPPLHTDGRLIKDSAGNTCF